MKSVIRRGVFETNSSSTHTLTIVGKGKKPDVDMEEISFEICSPTAKTFMVFALIENADSFSDRGHINWTRELMCRFKEASLTALAEVKGITREEALSEVECEAFGISELKKVLGDEAAIREYLKENKLFAAEYKEAKGKNIVEFAEEYYRSELALTKELMRGRYRCDAYFCNGCLVECDCGFETFRKMVKKFGLDRYDTDEVLLEKARVFLSDEYRMVAEELNAGIIPMTTGEKY